MTTAGEWEVYFDEMDRKDLMKVNKAINTIGDVAPEVAKKFWLNALDPLVKHAISKTEGFCNGCLAQYLKEWEPDDLIEYKERTGTIYKYCPDCYEDQVAHGNINPQGD